MPKKPAAAKGKKVTTVREHPRRVAVSARNPAGITIVDRHPRRISGPALSADDLRAIAEAYNKAKLVYPVADALDHKQGNKYDELIAIWVDYFNQKMGVSPPNAPLDPDLIKALLGSESGFRDDPPENKKAFGVSQITPSTLKILLDADGEAKDFLFKGIRQKDLKDPEIAIPLAVRWIFRKRQTAANALKRTPTPEEIVLDYKGLLKSKTDYKEQAVAKFRRYYSRLKNQ